MAIALAPEPQPVAVIYARISKDEADNHLGVDRQVKLCRDLAKRDGLVIADVLIDNDTSAFERKRRPAFEQLVETLQVGQVDAVVTYHSDRLYRRTADLERLVEVVEGSGVTVRTVASGAIDLSSASGRMVARMLGAAAQHESERLSERTKAKHDELAASGSFPGGRPPYGYSKGYVINPAEAKALRFMAQRVLEGASLLAVARELDAKGITTREGRPWHSSSVRASLINPAVVALRVHRREIAGPGNWEPVLDRETWEAVRATVADPARKRTRPAWKYLLAGLVFSPTDDPLNGRPDRDRNGEMNRRTYATPSWSKTAVSVDADKLEAHITEAVLIALDESELPSPASVSTPNSDVAAIEAELAELARLRGENVISFAEWLAAKGPIDHRLAEAKAAAGRVRKQSPKMEKLLSTKGAVRKAWKSLGFQQRRQIIQIVVERIVVEPAARGRHTPIEERVPLQHNLRWRV